MLMSEPLTLPGFEPEASNASTPSAAASPARTSASRVRVPVWTVSDPACGASTGAFLASFDPASQSWRTSELCGLEDSPEFSQTLPRSGSMRNGTLYLLPPLVRLTSAIASGSLPSGDQLPTPAARDANEAGSDAQTILERRERVKAKGINGNGFGLNLGQWAAVNAPRLIPTPTASLGDSSSRTIPSPSTARLRYQQGKRNLDDWASLNEASLLPTPQAEDSRNCSDYSDGSRGHSPQFRHLGSGRLNPRFVAWMMGFTPGWTEVD